MMWLLTVISKTLLILLLITSIRADGEIIGCGGFVKSHASIDFSKIEVKLYTKQGNLKDSAFCAPNNGYYFVPVYDKGDYVLKISPPPGWSFKPSHVDINIDGVSDLCSRGIDINFIFEGYGITGSVDTSGGTGKGPSGVNIQLIENGQVIGTTATEDGAFYFTPVYPGNYTLIASHPRWRLKSNQVQVQVETGNTEVPKKSLLIGGYDVNGAISFENRPVSNAYFILYSESLHPVYFEDCDTSSIIGYTGKKNKLCHVLSRKDGTFSFPMLSPGKYRIVPYLEEDNVKYLIEPPEVTFDVDTNTVDIKPNFVVTKFNVKGYVFTNVDGNSIPGAEIILNNKKITETLNDGSFILDGLTVGTYDLMIKAAGLKFEKEVLKLGTNMLVKSEFYPTSFQVCGNVASDQSHQINFKLIESKTATKTSDFSCQTETGTGDFCQFLPPGKYSASVKVTDKERAKGIQFFPIEQIFSLADNPQMGLFFSQLKATVIGKVRCIRTIDCANTKVILKMENPSSQDMEDIKYTATLNSQGQYEVPNVIPGKYIVTVESYKFCWKENQHVVTLTSEKTIIPDFIQVGYIITIEASHSTELQYKLLEGNSKDELPKLQIEPGTNTICVKTAGIYNFTPISCHKYEHSALVYDVDTASKALSLQPIKHLVTLDIKTDIIPGELYAEIKMENGVVTKQGPLKLKKMSDNSNLYTVEVYMKTGETVTVFPIAEYLWFEPKSYNMKGSDDCIDYGAKIFGKKGKIIQGKIIPKLENVEIIVTRSDGEKVATTTDKNGYYKFATLDSSYSYDIEAVKQSYSFTGPDANGNFLAHKLAEVIVVVIDKKDNKPLQGALISLSGSESYRSNLLTDNNGVIRFTSLNPSDYFLRPMMKEYHFEPPSQMFTVKDGATVNVKLSGTRVAYSSYGQVLTLNGNPAERTLVTAAGIGPCSMYSEEATTENDGHFRIRGLQPNCVYRVRVKESLENGFKIESSLPEFVQVKIGNEDVYGIKLTVVHQVPTMDILAHVMSSDPENFKNLRIRFCKENNPNNPIIKMKLDASLYRTQRLQNPGVLVHLPNVPLDNKLYFVRLESIAPQNLQSYEPIQFYFNANSSFKNVNAEYKPIVTHSDQAIGQTSVLILPFIALCIITFYNIDKITKFGIEQLDKLEINNLNVLIPKYTALSNDKTSNDDIDEIVQSINSSKIKKKVRKEK